MPREFKYRGYTLSQLQQISMDEFIKMLPSKYRRKLIRGLPPEHRKLLEEIREARKGGATQKTVPKTHCRDMVIMPEMVGKTIAVHNGREFLNVTIRPEMIGHLLGEFSITNKRVQHGNPGIGASRSSMYVPLK
jgi:small subunit ribosomal protein S19